MQEPDEALTIYLYKTVRYWLREWRFLKGEDLEDVIQESMVGMAKRYRRYDETKGRTKRGYALLCLKCSMLDALKSYTRHHRHITYVPLDEEIHETTDDIDDGYLLEESLEGRSLEIARRLYDGEDMEVVRSSFMMTDDEWTAEMERIRSSIIGL